MGLSSNARLLSITARLTSNEYESQQISNAKMRLANQAQQASEEYIHALNTPLYSFVTFDSSGASVKTALTVNSLYQYADSKNQYILTNAAGKALVSGEDAKNFRKSSTLQDFLACYGLEAEYKSKNLEKYAQAINGEMDIDGGSKTWNDALLKLKSEITNAKDTSSIYFGYSVPYYEEAKYRTFEEYDLRMAEYDEYVYLVNEGENFSKELETARDYVSSARQSTMDVMTYDSWLESIIRDTPVNNNCQSNKTFSAVGKYDAVTAAWENINDNGYLDVLKKVPLNGGRTSLGDLLSLINGHMSRFQKATGQIPVMNSDGSYSIQNMEYVGFNGSSDNTISGSGTYEYKAENNESISSPYSYNLSDTRAFFNGFQTCLTKCVEDDSTRIAAENFIKSIQDFYRSIPDQYAYIKPDFIGDETVKDTDPAITYKQAYEKLVEYKTNIAAYNAELEQLGISANEGFSYRDVSKAQWYTNLWYRMNGPSTVKSKDAQNNYNILESNLMSSTSWITNALKQGLISMEVASALNSKSALEDVNNPLLFNLSGITWASKTFSACSDIVESANDAEIAKAEAEYKRKTNEINAKDERYQRQISLLDSEHNALQNEYESVKTALSKNIERSYKAFQG